MEYKSLRQRFDLVSSQLEQEKQSFMPHWRDLSDYILPRRARFNTSDVNRGDRRNLKIYDNTATLAARTLASGMMSGITSPARPWFRITTPDPDLAEYGAVKDWLDIVQNRMTTSYLRSNLYNTLPIMYGDLGTFATAPISIEEDFSGEVFTSKSFPIGSYSIAKDDHGRVNTFYREFRMTVANLIEVFGQKVNGKYDWSNISLHVRNLYDNSQYQSWVDVCHLIMPNPDYDPKKPLSKFKKFLSYYYEKGTNYGVTRDQDVYLRSSGYDYFPILCPRWAVTGEDVYGTSCPGMDALGDIKQLQHGEKKTMEAIDKIISPPLKASTSLKNQSASILPGDITYVDNIGGGGFEPVYQVQFRVQEMEMKQNQVRQRIQRAYYEDLFLMLANSDRRQITAREIEERHEEKLLALGPVLEQLNQDLLDPLTDIVFDIHMRQGLIPPPPQELQGMDLKVEYISIMAQAQKMLGIGSLERFSGFVGQIAQFDPSVLKKVKAHQVIDKYADMVSVPPSILRTDEEVEAIEAQEQKAMQAQQQMQMMQAGAGVAKDLSQAQIGDDQNALSSILGL